MQYQAQGRPLVGVGKKAGMFWHGIRATLDGLGSKAEARIMRGTNTSECSCISCWRELGFVQCNGSYLAPTTGMLSSGSEARLGS